MRTMLLMVLLSATALADPTPPNNVDRMHNDDCARARKANKTCELTIEGEDVEGGKITPTESQILVNQFFTHASLITLRRDFIPEILKSAEDL